MRTQEFRRRLRISLKRYCKLNDLSQLKELRSEIERRYKKLCLSQCDFRPRVSTYGYGPIENDKLNMMYIYDRCCNCAFRLKWLIDGIDEYFI